MSEFDCSVIVPAFNAAAFLRETLDSLVGQTVPARKVIVVDDGSTDDTAEIAGRYGSEVTVLQQPNSGQGVARALGISSTNTRWIALCDADDIWERDHLSRRAELLRNYPEAGFTASDCRSFGSAAGSSIGVFDAAPPGWEEKWGLEVQDKIFWLNDPMVATLDFNPFYLSGLVFARSAYERMGGFLPEFSRWRAEDMEFTRRFLARGGVKVLCDKSKTWRYRRHEGNYSARQWLNLLARAKILEFHEKKGMVPEGLVERTREEIDNARATAFDIAYWTREYPAARDLFARELPANRCTIKRRLRALHARVLSLGVESVNLNVNPGSNKQSMVQDVPELCE